jgi:alginate O-acetyltransferase complex protein AlgI
MVFCSLIFLFLFLPIVLAVYFLLRSVPARNGFLLLASLFFYAWGEIRFVWIMLASIACNYLLAILINDAKTTTSKRALLGITIAVNLGILAFFKYSGFITQNLNLLLESIKLPAISLAKVDLPLGISFFTFHALSYVIDVYRGQAKAQRNPINLALYISLFPQLVAGPIIRYHDVCDQLTARETNLDKFAEGVRRFVTGLGKKMLIANTVAVAADKIFALQPAQVSPELAWLGAICYTLQIYFDFSGYSDMAIGLGLMFGFRFLENFNFPYIAQSIREFWQRWHISLSNWFRDYLYIPLGGNRHGQLRTCFNLLTVFFLCGLWHGANWTFVVWGLYHGFFLGVERLGFGKILDKVPRIMKHTYTLLAVVIGWVFFRAESLPQAVAILQAMFGHPASQPCEYTARFLLDGRVLFSIILGTILSTPVMRHFVFHPGETLDTPSLDRPAPVMLRPAQALAVVRTLLIVGILAFSIMEMASGTYNPFIYFRF